MSNIIDLRPNSLVMTTAEILYFFPDYPHVLQTFIWQTLDQNPDYPRVRLFLKYWEHHIEGRLHSVIVASAALNLEPTYLVLDGEFLLF